MLSNTNRKENFTVEELSELEQWIKDSFNTDLNNLRFNNNAPTILCMPYWRREFEVSDDINGRNPEDAIAIIGEFRGRMVALGNTSKQDYRESIESDVTSDYDGAYLESTYVYASWNELVENITDMQIANLVRGAMRYWLAPPNGTTFLPTPAYAQYLQFKEGRITWEQLRSTLYGIRR